MISKLTHCRVGRFIRDKEVVDITTAGGIPKTGRPRRFTGGRHGVVLVDSDRRRDSGKRFGVRRYVAEWIDITSGGKG